MVPAPTDGARGGRSRWAGAARDAQCGARQPHPPVGAPGRPGLAADAASSASAGANSSASALIGGSLVFRVSPGDLLPGYVYTAEVTFSLRAVYTADVPLPDVVAEAALSTSTAKTAAASALLAHLSASKASASSQLSATAEGGGGGA